MVLKIYGNIFASCTQRVITVLKELGIAYELVTVDLMSGETKTKEYLENRQPFGQVPSLEDDDGFKLFESRAIARYLAEKYGNGKLLPKDSKGKALFEQAASIELAQFEPAAFGICLEKVYKPKYGGKGDEKIAEVHQKTLEKKLEGYEIILGRQKFLGGDDVTLADLFHLPHGFLVADTVGLQALKSDSLPNVKRWWADISSRESWKAVQADIVQALRAA